MINKDVSVAIEKVCRSCMCENENMQNVFEKTSENVKLCDMLMACASVSVDSNDGLPNKLCGSCESKLNVAFLFKQQCEKSDSALRAITNQIITKNIDQELKGEADLFDDEDDEPLSNYGTKRKRGRPRKSSPTPYTCQFCHKDLQTKKGLKLHERKHTGNNLKFCFICNSQFTRTNHLLRHLNTHDKAGQDHSCSECDLKFAKAAELFEHLKSHNYEDKEDKNEINIADLVANDKIEIEENDDSRLDDTETLNDSKMDASEDGDKADTDEAINDDFFSNDNSDDSENENLAKDLDNEINKSKDDETNEKDKAIYECRECHKQLTTYVGLKIHMRRHTGDDLALCKLCNKSFTKKSHLTRHMALHGAEATTTVPPIAVKKEKQDKEKQIMECEFCDRKFKYKKSFAHHMQAEHGMTDENDIFTDSSVKPDHNSDQLSNDKSLDDSDVLDSSGQAQTEDSDLLKQLENDDQFNNGDDDPGKKNVKVHMCHVCPSVFARSNHLTRHMTLHRAVLVHQCDRCDKAFASKEFLDKHVEEEHINKPYVCTICSKPFSRGEHLIRHLKIHQTNKEDEPLKCSICDMMFTKSELLARHTKVHLLQDKRHVCLDCGKAFNRLDNLKTHQRIHTGVKDTTKLHLCIYCGKEFNNSSNMIVHMRRHTGERPYKCAECGKGFPRSHDLKCHERTHSGEKPYLCTLCGKSFNKSNKLLRHSRVHTGERPYVCNICGRAFTQSNDLALHMRRHTGARPYACGVCPARFIQSGQLKTHRRTTGHWMETQPDLKGGHRVEPVTPAAEPTPIRFKSHGKKKEECVETKLETVPHLLMDQKLVSFPTSELVNLNSVIHGTNGEELKFKTEVATYALQEAYTEKQIEPGPSSSMYHQTVNVAYSVPPTNTTFTTADNFTFQTFHQ